MIVARADMTFSTKFSVLSRLINFSGMAWPWRAHHHKKIEKNAPFLMDSSEREKGIQNKVSEYNGADTLSYYGAEQSAFLIFCGRVSIGSVHEKKLKLIHLPGSGFSEARDSGPSAYQSSRAKLIRALLLPECLAPISGLVQTPKESADQSGFFLSAPVRARGLRQHVGPV